MYSAEATSSSAIRKRKIKHNLKNAKAEVLQEAGNNRANSKSTTKSRGKYKSWGKTTSKSRQSLKTSKPKSKSSRRSEDCSGSEDNSTSDDGSTSEIISSERSENENWVESPTTKMPALIRESWMTDAVKFKTFTRENVQNPVTQQQQQNAYDPIKSSRELNPYWRSTGTGLPGLTNPIGAMEKYLEKPYPMYSSNQTSPSQPVTWKKKPRYNTKETEEEISIQNEINAKKINTELSELRSSICPIDQQMNELAAKILKAEIMNNQTLIAELKEKLEKLRLQKKLLNQNLSRCDSTSEQHILLSHTDAKGHSRPIAPYVHQTLSASDSHEAGHSRKKLKQTPTHENGMRQRYFADDDRYDLKQMFEKEKYISAVDNNLKFADIASKNKNGKDDLEDIFMEKISKDDRERSATRDIKKAIRDHCYLERVIDDCDKCLTSSKIKKELIIAIGKKVYLTLPQKVSLRPGHCILSTHYHSQCCTQLDEDVWQELTEFRQALTNMFAAQKMEVIFYENANKLHRKPHLVIHCIPVKKSDAEQAPLYFKKAIEESEVDWSINKQLILLKSRQINRCVPRGLPYFWVNFGMTSGYAHVIEDEHRFPSHFAEEVIAGISPLDATKRRKVRKNEDIKANVAAFANCWKQYDCTQPKTKKP